MKTIGYIIFVLTFVMAGCSRKESTAEMNFDREVYTPQYAAGFDIYGADSGESVLVTVRNPWQGASEVTRQLLILRNGEEAPKGFGGQILKGDAKRIVVMSSTNIAMLDVMGLTDCVVGVSDLPYVSNPKIRARAAEIVDIGHEGSVNHEALVACDPDLVLVNAVEAPSSLESKLRELGIPYLYIADYLEESPPGKAEWMVVLAEVLGVRTLGEGAFAEIPRRYNELKELVAAQNYDSRPRVMLNAPYGDAWLLPPDGSFVVSLLKDAGADYVGESIKGNAAVPVSIEEAYLYASDADLWINAGMATSLSELARNCPRLTDTKPFVTGKVFNNNAKVNAAGGNEYFETATVRPDLLLRDFVKMIHPELVSEDFEYYRQLE